MVEASTCSSKALTRTQNKSGDCPPGGVLFAACAHSLSQLEIARNTLLESVEVVSSGVGELVKKQMEGWAYIRP